MRTLGLILIGIASLVFVVVYAPFRVWFHKPTFDLYDDGCDVDDPGVDVDVSTEVSK